MPGPQPSGTAGAATPPAIAPFEVLRAVTGEPGELAAQPAVLRDAFPGYRFRRRDFRGVRCYVAEARCAADAPLAAARSPEILADMLAAAAGRPVRLRPVL